MSPASHIKVNIMRSLIVLVVCLTFLLSTSSTVLAKGASIKLSPKFGPPTAKVKVSGKGFGVSEQIVITFDSSNVGTATTNTSGSFSARITIPSSALPGNHTVQATGQISKLTAKATFLVRTDWNTYGFDPTHTHLNPYENVVNTSNASTLILDWSYPTVNGANNASPTVAGGVVYLASGNGTLYAISTSTHATLWSYKTGNGIDDSSPAVANGIVYFGSFDDNVYALNASTGAKIWSYNTGNFIDSSPTVMNNVVYIGTQNGVLYALDAKSGTKLWSFSAGNQVRLSPAVVNSMIYIGANNGNTGNVYALNASK